MLPVVFALGALGSLAALATSLSVAAAADSSAGAARGPESGALPTKRSPSEIFFTPLLDPGAVDRALAAFTATGSSPVGDRFAASGSDLFSGPFSGPFSSFLGADLTPESAQLTPESVRLKMDPLTGQDWAYAAIVRGEIDFIPSFRTRTREKITVAVLDTGVAGQHEDLKEALWGDPDLDPDKPSGFDFTKNRPGAEDIRFYDLEGCALDYSCRTGVDRSRYLVNPGHGTHVAGHIAAVFENTVGIRGASLGGASLLPLKIFFDQGHPQAGKSDYTVIVRAIDYAIARGAKILHASWGASMTDEEAAESPLRDALLRAGQAGMLVVAAAGNDGRNLDEENTGSPMFSRTYPAAYSLEMPHVIAVAATTREDRRAQFSAFGRKRVQIAAPGVDVFSTMVGPRPYGDRTGSLRGREGQELAPSWDGTSMAAPLVTGALAAFWSRHPDWPAFSIKERLLTRGRGCRMIPTLAMSIGCAGVLDLKGMFGY